MLMRYQAALRSDRGISGEAADHTDEERRAQCAGSESGLAQASEQRVEHLARREKVLRRGFELGFPGIGKCPGWRCRLYYRGGRRRAARSACRTERPYRGNDWG